MYDIIIVGAGPAGLTAAIYARRAEKSVLVIEKSTFGGQITHSPKVENYPGFASVSGLELGDRLIDHAFSQGAEIELDDVLGITGEAGNFTVKCQSGQYTGKTIILATGSNHRKLGLENEERFTGEGISYCAVCDGAFYKNKAVAVVGGGNTALQEAILLSDICEKVVIVQNLDTLTGEESLRNKIDAIDNIEILLSSTVKAILGEEIFKGIKINTPQGERDLHLDGMFVAIGQQPENEPFKELVRLNEYGYIVSGEDCVPVGAAEGIFTAGDCRTKKIRQVATAAADGATAALAACAFLESL